jgi:thioredoxin-related protein
MKIIIILLVGIILNNNWSFSQGSKQQKKSFPKIQNWEVEVEKAKQDNKYIMVDLSTEWCTSCKIADKKLFTDPEVLTLMNSKLNTYKLDAEKDSVGQLLKLKFGVCSYPSFLIFTSNGDYLETWYGYMPRWFWLQYVKDSIDTVPISRPGIPEGLKFEWPQFIQRELAAKFRNSAPEKEELKQYFAQSNYKTYKDFSICRMYPGDIPDSLLQLMLNDQTWMGANYGKDLSTDMLSTSINWKTYAAVQQKNWTTARAYMQKYHTHFPQFKWELFNAKLYYYQCKEETDSAIILGKANPDFIFEQVAQQLIDLVINCGKTKEQLQQALTWNEGAFSKEAGFNYYKNKALLNHKLANYEEARNDAKKALNTAKHENRKLTEADQILKQILKQQSNPSKPN